MFPHQSGQGPLPTTWQPPTSQQPAHGSYPPPPHLTTALPPPAQPPSRPDMATHHHQPPQPYRLPGPQEWNQVPSPSDPYRAQPPPPAYMNQHHQPPAPRQRTAIACRYCRRRKIRCSGFEATDDGRCSNCMRFNQDCIFTPVSAQTQAFVPAHTVWRGVGQPPPMYGAYGQPLPPSQHGDPYGPPPRQQQPPPQSQSPAYLPSPTGPPGPYQAPPAYGPSAAPYDDASRDALQGRKRTHPEPHTPTLPPPRTGSAASQLAHRGAGAESSYSEPPNAASPATSSTSYSTAPPQHAQQPYYTPQPPRRASPPAYHYEAGRASSSPHAQAPTTLGGSVYYAPPQTNGTLQPLPPRTDGTTPPPTSQPANRPGMRINDLVSDSGNGRSSTDSNMLNMLNRRPM